MYAEAHHVAAILEAGGLILYPTDTIWGIGCDATRADAVKRIFDLKERDDAKSLIVLVAEAKDIFKYVANPYPDIIATIQAFDRPTTVIYEQPVGLCEPLVHKDGTVAIRVVQDPFCKSLIKKLGRPITSTSANKSGAPSPESFKDIDPVLLQGVDYVVRHRQEEAPRHVRPSRILRILQDGSWEVIRP